eukprot:4203070-Lingulodinium_polyedra.AAC.1
MLQRLASASSRQWGGRCRSLCCRVAFVLELKARWARLSTDALLDTPVPRAAKRPRRVGPCPPGR